MKGLIASAARHPVLANLAMVVIMVGGFICFKQMRREMMPEISANRVMITTTYEGASADEVEEGIVIKIEEAIEGVDGIKNVDSVAREGIATMMVELEDEIKDVSRVLNDIQNRIDTIQFFPEDADDPKVSELLLTHPAALLVLQGDTQERVLRDLALEIKEELLVRPNISQVNVSGIREYEISIEVSEAKLRAYGISLAQVSDAVRRASLNLPGGSIRTRHEEFKIEVQGRRYRGLEYADVAVLARPDGSVVRLDQIAEIIDGFEEDERYGSFNGERAVMIRVMSTSDQDTIQLVNEVRAYLDQKRLELPEGISLKLLADFSGMITERIDLLVNNGLIGLLFLFLALWMFLNLRLAFWVAVGIPISFAVCGFVMYFVGQSANMLSLFGLIIVLGIVVDDAIVVGENIFAHQIEGMSRMEAAILGAKEMAWPVFATIITTVIAFMPMFFVSGIMGKFIIEVPIVVIAVLVGSLLESLFILPNHLGHELKKKKGPTFWSRVFGRDPHDTRPTIGQRIRKGLDDAVLWFIHSVYAPTFRLSLRQRYVTWALATACLIFTFGMVQGGYILYTIFPDSDSEFLTATVAFPEGTPIEETERAIARIEAGVLKLNKTHADRVREEAGPDATLIVGAYSEAGGGSFADEDNPLAASGQVHKGSAYITVIGPEKRTIDSEKILAEWRKNVGPMPDATTLKFSSIGGAGPGGSDMQIFILGENIDRMLEVAQRLEARLKTFPGVYDVQNDYQPGKRELQVDLKPQGRVLGITLQDLAMQLRQGFFGAESMRLQRGRDEVKVKVRYPKDERRTLQDLYRIRIRTPSGAEVPFKEVASVHMERGISEIQRRNGQRRIQVNGEIDEEMTTDNVVLGELEAPGGLIDQLKVSHPDVAISLEGPQEENRRSTQSLLTGMIFALMGIYAVLALVFRSYVQPVLIMAVIPLGMVGAIMGHWLMGFALTIMSMFGLVALMGVVVNDSLVLIDVINRQQRTGTPVFESIEKAGPLRFRAIILTTLTTVAGLAPLMFEQSFQAQFLIPMALSLAFGLMFATALTLFVIPCLFLILNDFRRVVSWLWTGYWPTREHVEPACKEFRRRQRRLAEQAAKSTDSDARGDGGKAPDTATIRPVTRKGPTASHAPSGE